MPSTEQTITWQPGDRAAFVPRHAFENAAHADARTGTVRGINWPYIVFQYDDNGHAHSIHHSRLFRPVHHEG